MVGGIRAAASVLGGACRRVWVAEDPEGNGLIGYARSIVRGGLFELTELFVKPGQQSRGLGRALLERAFTAGRGEVRSIIATADVRAQSRYYAAGTVARFPFFTLAREPMPAEPATTLEPMRIEAGADASADHATHYLKSAARNGQGKLVSESSF